MLGMRVTLSVATLFLYGFLDPVMAAEPQAATTKSYPLSSFDEIGHTCRAKGRLQDRDYCASHLMDQIVADGKDAIPILISQLRDTGSTKEPIYDDWSLTTAGDVAYFILNDLFTDTDWKTFHMPDMEALNDKDGHSYAQDCWRRFLKRHGRKFVQDQWLAACKKNEDHVYWDEEARCFRLRSVSAAKPALQNQ